jgi:uncharacterized protein (DUF2267 family)
MNAQNIPLLDRASQDAHEWINHVAEEMNHVTAPQAYHALRGVLFAIRDRLPPEEAVHLADQLPTLIRGLFFEGYSLGGKPEKIRDRQPFLEKIARETRQVEPSPEPSLALRGVSRVLASQIDRGQYIHVTQSLPEDLRELVAA